MRQTNSILLASFNRSKAEEFTAILKELRPALKLRRLDELVANPQALDRVETGKTYYENAFNKAQFVHFATKYPTLADDSGLEVEFLKGEPGLFSNRYGEPKGGETRDHANMMKLLATMKGVPKEKRGARFVCTLVFFMEGVVQTATGILEGSILEAPRGKNGFGYDPIFLVKGTDRSLAEMTAEEKNRLSHRAKAVENLFIDLDKKGFSPVAP